MGVKCKVHRLFRLVRCGSPFPSANRIDGGVGQYRRPTSYCYSFDRAVRRNNGFHLHDAAEFQITGQLGILRHNSANDFARAIELILLSKAGKG